MCTLHLFITAAFFLKRNKLIPELATDLLATNKMMHPVVFYFTKTVLKSPLC